MTPDTENLSTVFSHLSYQFILGGLQPNIGRGYHPIGLYVRKDEESVLRDVQSKGDEFLRVLPGHREMLKKMDLQ